MCHTRNPHELVLNLISVSLDAQDVDEMRRIVLNNLETTFEIDHGGFFLVEKDRFVRPCDLHIDPTRRDEYMRYFYRMSPFRPRPLVNKSQRKVFQLEDFVSRSAFENSEYYRDHYRYLNIYHQLGLYLRDGGQVKGFIALSRSSRQKPFSPQEMLLAEDVATHLAKPLRSLMMHDKTRRVSKVLEVVFAETSSGILVLNHRFETIYQNSRTNEILNKLGMETRKGRVAPRLFEKIQDALDPQDSALALKSAGLRNWKFSIDARRLNLEGSAPDEPSYYVEIKPFTRQRELDVGALKRDFHLSDREIEVLRCITLGLGNKQIAEKLCISPWTVVTHVKNIFTKMGVKNRTGAVKKAYDG